MKEVMPKREFNKTLWSKARLWVKYHTHMQHIWDACLAVIAAMLRRGQRIKLGELGSLMVVDVPERTRRINTHLADGLPKTMVVPAHKKLKFYPARKWRKL